MLGFFPGFSRQMKGHPSQQALRDSESAWILESPVNILLWRASPTQTGPREAPAVEASMHAAHCPPVGALPPVTTCQGTNGA